MRNNRQAGKLNEQKNDVDIIAYSRAANTNRNEDRCWPCGIHGTPSVRSINVRLMAIKKHAVQRKVYRSLRIFGIVTSIIHNSEEKKEKL